MGLFSLLKKKPVPQTAENIKSQPDMLSYSVASPRAVQVMGMGYGFDGSKFTGGLFPQYADPKSMDRSSLRHHSNEQYVSNSIAHNIINTKNYAIINTGLTLETRPLVGVIKNVLAKKTFHLDPDFEKRVEDMWNLWSNSQAIDYNFSMNLSEISSLAFREFLLNGKSLIVARYQPAPKRGRIGRLNLQIISQSRLCTPAQERTKKLNIGEEIIHGIHIDKSGTEVGYYVLNKHAYTSAYSILSKDQYTYIPRWGERTGRLNVISITNKLDSSDVEGFPDLTPVLQDLGKIEEYSVSELQAAAVNAAIALIQNADNNVAQSAIELGVGSKTITSSDGDGNEVQYVSHEVFAPGMHVVASRPGQKLESYRTERPNVNFGTFLENVASHIASSVSVPYEVLMKKFSNNYSASRAALLEFWRYVSTQMDFWSHKFYQPIYELWFADEVWQGRINAVGWDSEDPAVKAIVRKAWTNAEWNGARMGSIDPKKENEAAKLAENRAWTTAEDNARRLYNKDFDSNVARRKKEVPLQVDSFVVEPKAK